MTILSDFNFGTGTGTYANFHFDLELELSVKKVIGSKVLKKGSKFQRQSPKLIRADERWGRGLVTSNYKYILPIVSK